MAGIVAKQEAIGQNVFPRQYIRLPNTFDDKTSKPENPYSVTSQDIDRESLSWSESASRHHNHANSATKIDATH